MGRWEIFSRLRIGVMIAYVIAWNGLIVFGMWLGGRGISFQSVQSREMVVVACWCSAIVALVVAYSARAQGLTLRSVENVAQLRRELLRIAAIFAFVSIPQITVLLAQ